MCARIVFSVFGGFLGSSLGFRMCSWGGNSQHVGVKVSVFVGPVMDSPSVHGAVPRFLSKTHKQSFPKLSTAVQIKTTDTQSCGLLCNCNNANLDKTQLYLLWVCNSPSKRPTVINFLNVYLCKYVRAVLSDRETEESIFYWTIWNNLAKSFIYYFPALRDHTVYFWLLTVITDRPYRLQMLLLHSTVYIL